MVPPLAFAKRGPQTAFWEIALAEVGGVTMRYGDGGSQDQLLDFEFSEPKPLGLI
jgi:hypothetical protein